MIPLLTHCRIYLAAVLALSMGACLPLQGQPAPGGFGGFGGFGGAGGGNRSRSSTSTQYPRNGDIGNAVLSIDPQTHNLVVIADDDTLAHISSVVSNLDRPQPQVLIKVVFLEVQRDRGLDLGVDASFRGTTGYSPSSSLVTNFMVGPATTTVNGGTNGSTSTSILNSIIPQSISPLGMLPSSFLTGSNITGGSLLPGLSSGAGGLYQIMGQDYLVTLHAVATAGNAKILSRPSVIAANNQPATILVGQSVPLITSVRYDTFGNVINGVTYTDVGIILRVTPFITSDGLVQMILSPETSSIAATGGQVISSGPGGLNPITAPALNKRSADTVVVTPDGQTVIIGGLIYEEKDESESKVPFLGDIPILGNLFKRKITTEDKRELVIFLTPRVIQAPSQVAAMTQREESKSESYKALTDHQLEQFLDTLPTKNSTKKGAKKKPAAPASSN
jgi:general secretion pathway protein D